MIDHTKISKAEWLSLGRTFYSHLFAELDNLNGAEWNSPTRYLGWDCKDLVKHMTSAITINFNLLIQMALDGNPVPEPGFNLFLRNAEDVHRRKIKNTTETIAEFKEEINMILNRLEGLSEEQWKMPAFFFIGDVDVRTLFLLQFADNLVHEQDLLIANDRWKSFDPEFTAPLLDWFMRAFRPAGFRPERANGGSALVQYSITGTAGGDWFLQIKDNTCTGYQGTTLNHDIKVTTTVEGLITAALARPNPLAGKLARALAWPVKKENKEDFTAKFTGIVAGVSSLMSGKIKIEGNKRKAGAVGKKWFWHFWERTEQTQENILKSRYRK